MDATIGFCHASFNINHRFRPVILDNRALLLPVGGHWAHQFGIAAGIF